MAQVPETGYIREVRLTDRARKLEGERVELRRHARENYRLYGDWYGDPEVWHLTSWAASPLGHSAVERLFEDRELSSTEDSFAIHLKGEDAPIGVISLMNISEANESSVVESSLSSKRRSTAEGLKGDAAQLVRRQISGSPYHSP